MSAASIIGAYNSKFGSLVKRNKETGEITDLKSIYELIIEAGKGALSDAKITGQDVDGVWVDTAGRAGPYSTRWLTHQPSLAGYAVRHYPGL